MPVYETPPNDWEAQLRRRWAEKLNLQLADTLDLETGERGISRKELQRRLANLGYPVSIQAISYWCRGETAPRPELQAAIAKALNTTPRQLFPLPEVA